MDRDQCSLLRLQRLAQRSAGLAMGEKEPRRRCCEVEDLVEGEESRHLLVESRQPTVVTDYSQIGLQAFRTTPALNTVLGEYSNLGGVKCKHTNPRLLLSAQTRARRRRSGRDCRILGLGGSLAGDMQLLGRGWLGLILGLGLGFLFAAKKPLESAFDLGEGVRCCGDRCQCHEF